MSKHPKYILASLVAVFCLSLAACGGSDANNGGGVNGGGSGNGGGGGGGGGGTVTAQVLFTPVGDHLTQDLIDIEFLPGQNGESIVIGKDGEVFYLDGNFHQVGSTQTIATVVDGSERGLLNVAADPDYANNHLVYFYYTVDGNGTNPDVNRVERDHVSVDKNAGTFAIDNPFTIIDFNKNQSPSPGSNHNGGSMLFDSQGNMLIGVGDGGGGSSADKNRQPHPISQDTTLSLGKIHRIIPNRGMVGPPFTIPANQNVGTGNGATSYVLGVRNPFTLVVKTDGTLFIGDVGEGSFEEIDVATQAGENFGWPLCEGPCPVPPPDPNFVAPIHGYAHGDPTFNNQDPEVNPNSGEAIMASAFYQDNAYNGLFTGKLIYNEFFAGWVRLLTLGQGNAVTNDAQIGHIEGLTGLHENPADHLLYGQALFGSDQIQRMVLAPQ